MHTVGVVVWWCGGVAVTTKLVDRAGLWFGPQMQYVLSIHNHSSTPAMLLAFPLLKSLLTSTSHLCKYTKYNKIQQNTTKSKYNKMKHVTLSRHTRKNTVCLKSHFILFYYSKLYLFSSNTNFIYTSFHNKQNIPNYLSLRSSSLILTFC